ncbi:hypothetical protein SZ55_3814 [Pseudomonas sp. FeS53a]|nr:hypothetical protein SZ55_3814 [Pseudomonas sp. FeS53a]
MSCCVLHREGRPRKAPRPKLCMAHARGKPWWDMSVEAVAML